jgi:hypothetical protein
MFDGDKSNWVCWVKVLMATFNIDEHSALLLLFQAMKGNI